MSQDQLTQIFKDRLVSGLRRKSATSPSKYATLYRVMGGKRAGPWSFDYCPWAREMHDSTAEFNVGMKGAQLAFTECVINVAFYTLDILQESVAYILPNKNPDATDFSSGRFDPALFLSPHLGALFTDVKNVGHKRTGAADLYIRGSNSQAQLRSLPVRLIILDEVDVMNQKNVPLAWERASGQEEKLIWMVSTPTIHRKGIHLWFTESSQDHFFFRCPHCSKLTELIFPDCLVVAGDDPFDVNISRSHLICKECKHVLDHAAKRDFLKEGTWVSQRENRTMRGFHISQLYSITERPDSLARAYLLGLIDPAAEQEFFNSKLGVPHVVAGGQVTEEDLVKCTKTHRNTDPPYRTENIRTIGIDVGTFCHYEVDEWLIPNDANYNLVDVESKCKVLRQGKAANFHELAQVIEEFRPHHFVIDAHPEQRKAKELVMRYFGIGSTCVYSRGGNGRELVYREEDCRVSVDRTSWLDLSQGRFHRRSIELPADTPEEYKAHIQSLARVYETDPDGNKVARYQERGADHYAHARNYSEIAFALARGLAVPQNISAGEI